MSQPTSDSRSHHEPDAIHGVGVAQEEPESPLTYLDDMLALAPVPPDGMGHAMVLNSPDVRIIILSFAAGHILKQHAAPFTLLMQALDGKLRIVSAGQEIDLEPGGLIRMDSGLPHSVEAYVDSRLMLTLIAA